MSNQLVIDMLESSCYASGRNFASIKRNMRRGYQWISYR